MAAMKRLLPSLREKKRYLVFEVMSEQELGSSNDVLKQLKTQITNYLGQKGMADSGIIVLKETYNAEKQKGIIKVGHKFVDQLKTALMLIKKINEKDVIVRSITVSGILKIAKFKIK